MEQVIHRVSHTHKYPSNDRVHISGRSVVTFLIGLVIVSYLIFHSVEGKRGVYVLHDLEKVLEKEQFVLASLQAEKKNLQAMRFYLSNPEDYPDYIDERIRQKLGYIQEGDRVIITP